MTESEAGTEGSMIRPRRRTTVPRSVGKAVIRRSKRGKNAPVLAPCPIEDVDDDGRIKQSFFEGATPANVVREVIDHLVRRNRQFLDEGGFHEGLLFRQGNDVVTLVRDPDTSAVTVMKMEIRDLRARSDAAAGARRRVAAPGDPARRELRVPRGLRPRDP
jgi:hypothetical protein